MMTAPEMAEDLRAAAADDPWAIANLDLMRRAHARATALPTALVEAATRANSTCEKVWRDAKASSAAKTVDRIINVFPTNQQEQVRTMLGESLKGVIAQQLLRTVEGKRCAALEILAVTPAVSNLIREGKTFQIPSVIQTGRAQGMMLMDQAIQDLLTAGKITREEAYKFAANKSQFQ